MSGIPLAKVEPSKSQMFDLTGLRPDLVHNATQRVLSHLGRLGAQPTVQDPDSHTFPPGNTLAGKGV